MKCKYGYVVYARKLVAKFVHICITGAKYLAVTLGEGIFSTVSYI